MSMIKAARTGNIVIALQILNSHRMQMTSLEAQ